MTRARLAAATQPSTGQLLGLLTKKHYVVNYISRRGDLQYYVVSDQEEERQLTRREIEEFVEVGTPVSMTSFGLDSSGASFQLNAHESAFSELVFVRVELPEGYRAEASGAEVLQYLAKVLDFGHQFELLQEAHTAVVESQTLLAERRLAYRSTTPGTIDRLDRAKELLAAFERLLTARKEYADVAGIQPNVRELNVDRDEVEIEISNLDGRVDRNLAKQLEARLDELEPKIVSAWHGVRRLRMSLVDWLENGRPLLDLLETYLKISVALRSVGGLPSVKTEIVEISLAALSARLATAQLLLERGCAIEPVDRSKLARLVEEQIPDRAIATTIRRCGITFEVSEMELKRFQSLGLGKESIESLRSALHVDWPMLRAVDGLQ